MTYSIYKYTNPHNNKCYVGLTKNVSKRRIQHRLQNNPCRALASAFAKYGESTFDFEVLVTNIESLEEATSLEIKYITKYDSYINGYNLTKGGIAGERSNGEDCHLSKLTEQQAIEIIMSPTSGSIIANQYGISPVTVNNIRSGTNWSHLDRSQAPKYNSGKQKLTEQQAEAIILSPKSHSVLGRELGIRTNVISAIRSGKYWKQLDRSKAPVYVNGRKTKANQ